MWCTRFCWALWSLISDVYRSFIANKTTFTKYCLIQWISKLLGSFEIHGVRQYLANFMGLAGIVNTTVYKAAPILTGLRHGKLSWSLAMDSKGFYFWKKYINFKYFFHTCNILLGVKQEQDVNTIRNIWKLYKFVHRGLNKMAAILQITFLNSYSWGDYKIRNFLKKNLLISDLK